MEQKTGLGQLNTGQVERHLRSAVSALAPDVLSRIDFDVPQNAVSHEARDAQAAVLRLQRRMRGFVLAAAACLCVMVIGGGAYNYHVQNRRVESVIGIDVNPSIELLINKKEKVLGVRALNEEGAEILAGMDLAGTDLNVAVNAVVGAMVTYGYLDDFDNAILVTVSNDSVRKAKELRASIVLDIEQTLEENQVQAVVYDQQVIEEEEMMALAEEYGISYGKAYFLKELIDQNPELAMDDMAELSSMTMEEIAARIAEGPYMLGELADRVAETAAPERPETEPETTQPQTEPESLEAETTQPVSTAEETVAALETTAAAPATEAEETEAVRGGQVEIDYVDYEDGTIYVCFVTRVKWKNPTVAVRDDEGNSYSAMVDETSSDECTIEVSGLEGGRSYTFVLGGLTPREGGGATTVKGYFDVPDIADGATEGYDDDEDEAADGKGADRNDDNRIDGIQDDGIQDDGIQDDGIQDDGNHGNHGDGGYGNGGNTGDGKVEESEAGSGSGTDDQQKPGDSELKNESGESPSGPPVPEDRTDEDVNGQ